MKIFFLSKYAWPHIGGVERHVKAIGDRLQVTGNKVTTISEEDINPPHTKIFGLLYIWFWLFKEREIIARSDLVHIHDVFIWYLPFRFLFPFKKTYITFHGWEGKWPLPMWTIINKIIANYLCNGSIAVGKYIEKYYHIKCNEIIYGAAESHGDVNDKRNLPLRGKLPDTMIYLGRQDKDTGYFEFQEWLKDHKNLKVKYVTNDPNPEKYLSTSEYCVPAGYLSYLEARSYGCKIITFANNPLKVDYWKEVKVLRKVPTWDDVTKIYLKLWKIKK